MKQFTILTLTITLLAVAKISLAQEWIPVFNFNSVNGQVIASDGDKLFCYQSYNFLNESYEAMISLDNGSTWTQVHDDKFATAFFNSQGNLYAVRQDKFPGTNLYFPQSIFLTTDNGNSWSTIDTVANNMGQVNASVFRKDNSGTLYTAFRDFSANTGGFKYSLDDGASWTLIPTFTSGPASYEDVYSALVSSNGDFYITTYNSGLYKSVDAGANWTKVYNTFVTLGYLNEHPTTGDLYVASYGAILRSTDNGENWEELNPDPWMAMNITRFEIASDGTFYFSNSGGAYKSDDGIHWESIWSPGVRSSGATSLLNMSISENYIYISANDSTIYRGLRGTSTNISTFNENSTLRIYPVPAQDYITINYNDGNDNTTKFSLSITDMSGKLVCEKALHATINHRIDLSDFDSGIYVVTCLSGSHTTQRKLVVNR